MKKIAIYTIFLLIFFLDLAEPRAQDRPTIWSVQSIDTMKFSRDLAREKLGDLAYGKTIEEQVKKIAATGATHIAIGTPYDEEFLPYLKSWVHYARKNNLKVWFRGNFSGWEGWFSYPRISKEEHLIKTKKFILDNPELFEDGDIFTSCTECENGKLGDPRSTGNIQEYRNFLIDLYHLTQDSFRLIDKNVTSNYFSMNADVAMLIMDKETTDKLGGTVTIDHYVKTPEKLIEDIEKIAKNSQGKVVLGEFGMPIPNLHGTANEKEQSEWISTALEGLAKSENLTGINYWTAFGGSTSIWDESGKESPTVKIMKDYFSPIVVNGRVINEIGFPVKNALIAGAARNIKTDKKGEFEIIVPASTKNVEISVKDYKNKQIDISNSNLNEITLEKEKEGIFFVILKNLYKLFRNWFGQN